MDVWSTISPAEQLAFYVVFRNRSKALDQIVTFCQKQSLAFIDWWRSPPADSCANLSPASLERKLQFDTRFTPDSFWEWLTERKIRVCFENDNHYPPLLKHCSDKPGLLFELCAYENERDWSWEGKVPVAVVGTRHPTTYGVLATKKIVAELVQQGLVIVSGGMYGLDTVAHQTAMGHQGCTVAILGKGFHHLTRQESILVQAILDSKGLVFSEYPPWQTGNKNTFPVRNRLIAGMSWGTVVTEAAAKSGTMITVNFSLEYGRLVWAVPGPITSEYFQGTKYLLQQGAALASSGQDIWTELKVMLSPTEIAAFSQEKWQKLALPTEAYQILKMIVNKSMSIEELQFGSGMPIPLLTATLSVLELAGAIKKQAQKWVALA